MKKLLIGTLLTLTAFSLLACSGNKKSEKKSEKESEVKQETVDNSKPDEPIEDSDEEIKDEPIFNEDSEDEVSDGNTTDDTSYVGKKLSELYDAGFEYSGYGGNGDIYEIYLNKIEVEDESIKKIVADLEGMKVKDFIDSGLYGDISYMGFGDQYIFSSYIGGINFSFDLDESVEIMALYEDDPFMDVEDMEEFYEKTLTNVSFDYIEYIVVLEENVDDIINSDNFEEDMLNDCIVKKCYYKSAS